MTALKVDDRQNLVIGGDQRVIVYSPSEKQAIASFTPHLDTYSRFALYHTVWNWLKKLQGVLRVPRPSHSKKDSDAAEAFKSSVPEKLEALEIEAGSQVKVWFMDKARFGLHTDLRRVWTIKGTRPIVTRQIKYQWDYLYGALGAVGGDVHFMHVPGVSLEWDGAIWRTSYGR